MDPMINRQEQYKLAHKILHLSDALVPDDMHITRLATRLAELVLALDGWQDKGGFSPNNGLTSPEKTQ